MPASVSSSQRKKLVPFARRLRRESTEAERLLWSKLRAGRLAGFPFKRQVPCCGCILDFACVSRKLAVELDGSQHAESVRDVVRDDVLAREGWRILRFWNNELYANLDGVLETILHALENGERP